MRLEDRIREGFSPIRLAANVSSIRSAGRQRRYARRAFFLTGIVTFIAFGAILAPALWPGAHEPSAAARALHGLALVAADQPVESVGPDQYLYSKFEARWQSCEGTDCLWQRNVRETWTATDGSGRMAGSRGPVEFSELVGPGELLGSLVNPPPVDVDALRSYIQERASHADQPLDYEMFVVTADLLRETFSSPLLYTEPQLRASLFEVAATLPGVAYLGETRDELGRPGIGVGYAHGATRLELIFDPSTSAILGERQVELASGETIRGSWIAYLESAVVDSTDERP